MWVITNKFLHAVCSEKHYLISHEITWFCFLLKKYSSVSGQLFFPLAVCSSRFASITNAHCAWRWSEELKCTKGCMAHACRSRISYRNVEILVEMCSTFRMFLIFINQECIENGFIWFGLSIYL